ncbi:uroporphyrinogen-III C-methyltransferase [Alicyclobacillus tolerans]|uniref:uroporphyrinogen-III C-methyltransferase n=1 Tax=Alicyclobacillus tolerans TaxID=90970 RepID=UPI001EFFBE87|nr:uroporphyrinogen-III C-methyltransferase [Alicyclobacillus tolerans]MCF8565433.1 uroporphyrinogen-III C-methyltransferase [Alicyclobacillus tolerans]
MAGIVYLIGAGPGDPGLLTLKAKDCLERSNVVIYDRLVSPEILAFVPSCAERIFVGKEANNHTRPQAEIDALLVEKALQGLTVSRLKGGDPFVYGRGGEEAESLAARGIPFEIVPGISSVIAVPAYAGIPLTHRRLASGFHVVTGHECLHSSGTPWTVLALTSQTLVILMGMGHLREISEKLIVHGRNPDTPVAVVEWGTTSKQEVAVGTLLNISNVVKEAQLQPPAVIVVGDVVRLRDRLQWFKPAVELSR